jgi:hypothetical protein
MGGSLLGRWHHGQLRSWRRWLPRAFTGTASFAGNINMTGTGAIDVAAGTTAQSVMPWLA